MIIHVLPGDAYASEFNESGLDGEVVYCRECLVIGDVSGETLEEFWDRRSNFIAIECGGDPIDYQENVAYELERLIGLPPEAEVNLWFEYELFCQVNMWFCMDLLQRFEGPVYRVEPLNVAPDDIWKGFAKMNGAALRSCYDGRTRVTTKDLGIGSELWAAFRERNSRRLLELGEYVSPAFPMLRMVCEAAAELETRPAHIVRELQGKGLTTLDVLFPAFQQEAGVYGFGDTQVARLMDAA
jgi:hypothetical protein